ncbi:hypothetical protein BFS30_01420 [Pedobacter steynii]|uniref:Uncharacterized protein n=1 Tax=Pedobacter steynii TaxID=430522 RepID=A0A1D7QB77_9SPHI|nr:hypothetical protein BFS30_01420 [Pedobacter steynii]
MYLERMFQLKFLLQMFFTKISPSVKIIVQWQFLGHLTLESELNHAELSTKISEDILQLINHRIK